METQYRVEVLVPPSITSVAARGEVREGDAAELECQGGQQPPAGTHVSKLCPDFSEDTSRHRV